MEYIGTLIMLHRDTKAQKACQNDQDVKTQAPSWTVYARKKMKSMLFEIRYGGFGSHRGNEDVIADTLRLNILDMKPGERAPMEIERLE